MTGRDREPLTPIGAAAVEYARRGWFVVPLHGVLEPGRCTCSRGSACPNIGKHPRGLNWQRVCSNDPEFVAGTWAHYGETANVGIVTGRSGLVVVDIDTDDGLGTLSGATGGDIGTDWVVRTARGWHLYFKADPDGAQLRPQAGGGLDLRAGNSFVVAPPSIHRTGSRYEWVTL